MSERIPVIYYGGFTEVPFITLEGSIWRVDKERIKNLMGPTKTAGVDIARVLPWGVWGERPDGIKSQFQPYAIIGDQFDLSQCDPFSQFWSCWRTIIQTLNDLGIQVRFCWLDNCQFNGAYRRFSPWANNIQGINDFYDPRAHPFVKTFIEMAIEKFSGFDMSWAWGNETNDGGMRSLASQVIHGIVREKNLDFNKMTYGASAVPGRYLGVLPNDAYPYDNNPPNVQDLLSKDIYPVFGEEAKLRIAKEVHGCGGPDEDRRVFGNEYYFMLRSWGRNPIRKVISDDGVFGGGSLCDKTEYQGQTQARPSSERWGEMVRYTTDNCFIESGGIDKLISFEHGPKNIDVECQYNTFAAISRAIGVNVPPYSLPQPQPEPEPNPEPQPNPVNKSCYEKYIKARPMRLWQVGRYLSCIFLGKS